MVCYPLFTSVYLYYAKVNCYMTSVYKDRADYIEAWCGSNNIATHSQASGSMDSIHLLIVTYVKLLFYVDPN